MNYQFEIPKVSFNNFIASHNCYIGSVNCFVLVNNFAFIQNFDKRTNNIFFSKTSIGQYISIAKYRKTDRLSNALVIYIFSLANTASPGAFIIPATGRSRASTVNQTVCSILTIT